MAATAIFLVCSGFVVLASDPDHRKPIDNVSLTIDLRAGRVSGFSKGTVEKTNLASQIGWIDHDCRDLSAIGAFDRVTGETHAGVCSQSASNRGRPGLDYYTMTCVPIQRRS
jgi:hypothetical protein